MAGDVMSADAMMREIYRRATQDICFPEKRSREKKTTFGSKSGGSGTVAK